MNQKILYLNCNMLSRIFKKPRQIDAILNEIIVLKDKYIETCINENGETFIKMPNNVICVLAKRMVKSWNSDYSYNDLEIKGKCIGIINGNIVLKKCVPQIPNAFKIIAIKRQVTHDE